MLAVAIPARKGSRGCSILYSTRISVMERLLRQLGGADMPWGDLEASADWVVWWVQNDSSSEMEQRDT